MFTEKDINQFAKQGITVEDVEKQIDNFKQGFPFLNISAPAVADKGIIRLNEEQQSYYLNEYDNWNGTRLKFVPASGAATRMFKVLYEVMQKLDENQTIDWDEKSMHPVVEFFKRLKDFAFYEQLKQIVLKKGIDIDEITTKHYNVVLHCLLDSDGLNYGALPKGLLSFHKYSGEVVRTAFEEHLMEGALYGRDSKQISALHFTVSPEHYNEFFKLYNKVHVDFEKQYNTKYEISFSEQKKSTDTIAVTLDNKPFRNADGSILFRPAGHGALLANLNELEADVIFIKNIDNVVPERHVDDTVKWKKILAAILVEKQNIVFNYLEQLDKKQYDEAKLSEIIHFLKDIFCVTLPENIDYNTIVDCLREKLNRPIRVCGMVKNEGEPGGGPFIAYDPDGSLSLQIAEAQQIDINNEKQKDILKSSTHFNPVDLVCSPRNYKGGKFDLLQYCDAATGFISIKSKDGKDLKAQELPGLWNGAMSNWNTIFVEVPLSTFNPVKTVNDLLREEHQ